MSQPQVDYDKIAPSYDRRYTGQKRNGISTALLELAFGTGVQKILEVGCGTAHWLTSIRDQAGSVRPNAEIALYGLDLSSGMLSQAYSQNQEMRLAQGKASNLPFGGHTFDLVYCVNAIHHFSQPRAFIAEARRALRPGGALGIIGMDPRGHRDDWYIYRYFPGTFEIDLERFPSWETILDWIAELGFHDITQRLVEHIHDPKTGTAVLDDPYLRKDAVSQLALLSDEAYQEGLERIQNALTSGERSGETVVFPCDIYQHLLVARVPEP